VERPYNEEGLKNHFLADGSNFLIRTGREYERIFPAYDWRKIPGTTVVQKSGMPDPDLIQQEGKTSFVGGLSDGNYGIVSFDFDSPIDNLQARKAWFFFDREYVALGSGIRSNENDRVATTLDQRSHSGEVYVHDGTSVINPSPGEHAFAEANWLWHDNVGYIFGQQTDLMLHYGPSEGSWRSINKQNWATDEIVTIDLFTAWIDHGRRPRWSTYSYVVVPGVSTEDLKQYHRQMPIEILSNTAQIQAVMQKESGIYQFIFYERTRFQSDFGLRISVDQPCLLMLTVADGKIQNVVVADPSRASKSISFSINSQINGQNPDWDIRWNPISWQSNVKVSLPTGDRAGKSTTLN
jgi:chondroitin AC lyase